MFLFIFYRLFFFKIKIVGIKVWDWRFFCSKLSVDKYVRKKDVKQITCNQKMVFARLEQRGMSEITYYKKRTGAEDIRRNRCTCVL
jgi:hypothetical protein